MASFFIRRPIVAIVIATLPSSLARSRLRFCQSHSFRTLRHRKSGCKLTTRCRRKDSRAVRRYADRTASDRCGQHGIHVFREHH